MRHASIRIRRAKRQGREGLWRNHAGTPRRAGTALGRIWAQGTARVGEHYGVQRVPVIKKQAISAYDPRVVEVTGITMMVTAQGADHTAGNLPRLKTREMQPADMISQSLLHQTRVAANDSLGFCIFGMTVTNFNQDFVVDAINGAHGTELTTAFFEKLGRETLRVTDRPGMAKWRERLFVTMLRNATTADVFFKLPPDRTIELGVQVEL